MAGERSTADHEEIRRWVEECGARPARVKGTGGNGDPGILRIDFPGGAGKDALEPIAWEEWLEAFERNKLALLYQGETKDEQPRRLAKLVNRNGDRSG